MVDYDISVKRRLRLPVFTLKNSYNQLAAICNDSVYNNSTTNDGSLLDDDQDTEATTVVSDSFIVKHNQINSTAITTDILQQLNPNVINKLEVKQEEEEDHAFKTYTSGRLSCMKCHEGMKKLSYLAIHHRSHTSNMHFTCPQCQCIFHTLNGLSSHCQKHSKVQASCPKCDECFEDSRLFKMHLEVHIIEMESNDDEVQAELDEPDIDKAMLYNDIYHLSEIVLARSIGKSRYSHDELFLCKYCSMVCTSKVRHSIHLLGHKEYIVLTTDN